jgi:hypothetical protein
MRRGIVRCKLGPILQVSGDGDAESSAIAACQWQTLPLAGNKARDSLRQRRLAQYDLADAASPLALDIGDKATDVSALSDAAI